MAPKKRSTSAGGSGKRKQKSLYDLLRVPAGTSDPVQLRRAYRVVARELHPDKHLDDKEGATKAFQEIQRAFEILSDPQKRELYDQTGSEEGLDFAAAHDFVDAFCHRVPQEEFKKMVAALEKAYKGSEEERLEVVEHVRKHKGDVTHLMEYIILSKLEDADRFEEIIRTAFKKKELPQKHEAKFCATLPIMKKKEQKERRLFEQEQTKTKGKKTGDLADLALAIQKNAKRRLASAGPLANAIKGGLPEDPLEGKDLDEVRKQMNLNLNRKQMERSGAGIKRKASTSKSPVAKKQK